MPVFILPLHDAGNFIEVMYFAIDTYVAFGHETCLVIVVVGIAFLGGIDVYVASFHGIPTFDHLSFSVISDPFACVECIVV